MAPPLSHFLETNWVHCRPRPGSAVLIGVAFVSERPTMVVRSASESPLDVPHENLSEQGG